MSQISQISDGIVHITISLAVKNFLIKHFIHNILRSRLMTEFIPLVVSSLHLETLGVLLFSVSDFSSMTGADQRKMSTLARHTARTLLSPGVLAP